MAKAHPRWMNPTRRNSAAAGYRNWRRHRQPRTDARRLCAVDAPRTPFRGCRPLVLGISGALDATSRTAPLFLPCFFPLFSTKIPVRKQNRFLAAPVGAPKTLLALFPWQRGKQPRVLTRFSLFFPFFTPILSTSPVSQDLVCVLEPVVACIGVTMPASGW